MATIKKVINNGDEYCIGGKEYSVATETCDGLMSASDKKRLDGLTIRAIDLLVVGGGGGGGGAGKYCKGGGGGAGEVKIVYNQNIIGTSFCVKIGSGGAGGTGGCIGGKGCQSSFGNIVAIGGGGGGGYSGGCSNCMDGGSGGGAAESGSRYGIGFHGHNGGPGVCNNGGGGGGGASGDGGGDVGCCNILNGGTFGGPGICTNFPGTTLCIGGGGGGSGSIYCWGKISTAYWGPALGQYYGGGNGGCNSPISNGCPGTTNTGGGGGAGGKCCSGDGGCCGGAGGSGLVIVRYPANGSYGITSATGGTITTCTIDGISYKIHKFTSNGTFTITG